MEGSEMKKTSNIFLTVIVLSAYFLCVPCLGTTNHFSHSKAEQLSSEALQKDRVTRLVGLPEKAREKISQHLRKAEYEVSKCERTLLSGKTSNYLAFNRNQNLSAYFNEQGVHLLPNGQGEPAWHLEMTLSAYGYDGAMELAQPVRPGEINVSGKHVEYDRGALIEWYENDEQGLEQGVTLKKRPAEKDTGPLVVEWTVFGTLVPRLEQKGTVIAFCKTGDESVLRYSGLKAWDATGRSLPAKMAVINDGAKGSIFRIAYVVDDVGALYPVIIDPVFTQTKKITASDADADDMFGVSVSISGDMVVVGADGDDENDPWSGAAYIFYRDQGGTDNWGQVTKITASDGASGDRFGISVSINGDMVVVGALKSDGNISNSGAAYIFYRDQGGTDNWGQVQKIIASDGAAWDYFGIRVSINGGTVVVGAAGDDDNGDGSGAAYIFYRDQGGTDNWGQVTKITASDGAAGDYFGRSVSINGDTVVVGADGDDDNGIMSGAAYIFYRDQGGTDNWGQVQKIIASDGAALDYFGWSISINGGTVVVGAPSTFGYTNSGAAYIFSVPTPIPDIKANGSDGSITITISDTLSVTIELDPGDYPGVQADWWCVADTPLGWYYYDDTGTWLPGFYVSYQGPLFTLTPPLEVLSMSGLPIGGYTFYFGVDGNRNVL
jgi:spore coat protein U-like protein